MSGGPAPRANERARRAARALGLDRLSIFVPAVMSVGLLFWLLTELRDIARSRRDRNRAKRAELAAVYLTEALQAPASSEDLVAQQHGLRPRPVYLLIGLATLGAALYVTIGSIANYRRTDGYVSNVAWLLALSLAVSAAAVVVGVAALHTFVRYPQVPRPLQRIMAAMPLTTAPRTGAELPGPPWQLSAALATGWAGFAVLSLMVGWSPHVVRALDEDVSSWARRHPLPGPSLYLDVIGSTPFGVLAMIVLLAVAARRCRVLFLAALGALVAGQLGGRLVRDLVGRDRPPLGPLANRTDSFPSGHVVLLCVIAGVAPLVLASVVRRGWFLWPLRLTMGVLVALLGYQRVFEQVHWPTDIAGSVLLGLALAMSVEWALGAIWAHRHCPAACAVRRTLPAGVAVAPHGHGPHRGVFALPAGWGGRLALAAHLSAAGAAVGLVALSFVRGVPRNPEGSGLGSVLERPTQLALAALVSIAALVGWRWPAVGAVLLAIAASGLGIFAAVEYPPTVGVLLTTALLVPAVLLWAGWQHERRPVEITAVAAVTALLMGATWVGAARTYDRYFGASHPASSAPMVGADRVEWLWMGALTSDGITVTARIAGEGAGARMIATPEPGGSAHAAEASVEATVDAAGIARAELSGLEPATRYQLSVVVDGHRDEGRGNAWFRTAPAGAASFRVAVGSCVRTASNGAVFDAVAATDPLLFLHLGDLHYQNLTATSPGPFLDAFGRALDQPGQAALARQVPMAYVWDDHDYGGNDADASSPSRRAARAAYRAAVPHYPLPLDTINQAFTIGRVRFVLTDGRSEKTDTTLLGEAQRAWLIEEIIAASRTHALVVWANPTPWIGPATPGADTWAAYPDERAAIATALHDAAVTNLVMVSGDAHMVALDDGTNSGYATSAGGSSGSGSGGFPVLHAAALDRPGSIKGGPYSDGAFPGGGQFGLIDIEDSASHIAVRLSGQRWDGTELLSRTFRFPVDANALAGASK